jgi:general secretion pathway protein E
MSFQEANLPEAVPDRLVSRPGPIVASLKETAEECGIAFAETLDEREPWDDFVSKVPISFARRHGVLGFAPVGDSPAGFALALSGLESWEQVDVLSRCLGRFADPVLAPPEAVQAAINRVYQQQTGQADAMLQSLNRQEVLDEVDSLATREDLLDVASRAPVIKLVNLMLFEAVQNAASDVHVQPYENRLVVRLRIDGVLYNIFELPKRLQEEVVSRLKVVGRMNIAEKRIAQDGRATAQVGDRVIDLRIASLPSSFGERVVIRLLDKSARLYRLPEIGMPPDTLARFRKLIAREHGLLLVTGPTGSGKSTTLYSALRAAQHPHARGSDRVSA